MAEEENWRHGKAYDYVDQLDPASLAWEFLRRNRNYKENYKRIPKKERGSSNDEMTLSWGLRFPGEPRLARNRCRHLLCSALRSWHDHPDSALIGTFA